MTLADRKPAPAGRAPWRLAAWALIIPSLYLPTLLLRFDFVDDGCLVYARAGATLGKHFEHIWAATVADFETNGPFRPVCWAHWEAAASLAGPHARSHRLGRLAWAVLATGTLLWLLCELGFAMPAVLGTTALALWNPFRNEIWLGLGLTEAFAMPYALLALVGAVRASRSPRRWPWDLLSVACLVAALGIKNTFAAVVPAAVLLRLTGNGLSLREGWRRHWLGATAVGLTLLVPLAHFLVLQLSPQDHTYKVHFTWLQVPRYLRALASAANWQYVVLGLLLPLLALGIARRKRTAGTPATPLAQRFRPALGTGLLLTAAGIGIYLPIDGVSGRYTMPAVWGLDILTAFLLTAVLELGGVVWKRVALAGLAAYLLVAGVSNLGKQWRYYARADLLWQALEFVETHASPGTVVAWLGTSSLAPRPDELAFGEGCHFRWHLQARNRADLSVDLVEQKQAARITAPVVVAGTPPPPEDRHWQARRCRASFWAGARQYECFVWVRTGPDPPS
jgi:hypothetical protein